MKQKEQREKDPGRNSMLPATENEVKIVDKLEEMAERKGTLITSIAMA